MPWSPFRPVATTTTATTPLRQPFQHGTDRKFTDVRKGTADHRPDDSSNGHRHHHFKFDHIGTVPVIEGQRVDGGRVVVFIAPA